MTLAHHPVAPGPAVLDCVVVGGGPAGLTAGLYLRRFLREVRVVDAGAGRARRIACSRNVAGFPEGIAGVALLARMTQQLQQVGGQVTPGRVCTLERRADGVFAVGLADERPGEPQGSALLARRVMLCTGVRDRLPAVPGAAEVEAAGRLRYCPVCDGYEHRGQRVGVIGHSAHGVREAAFLLNFSRHVRFIRAGDGGEPLDAALRASGVAALPGRLGRLGLGPDGAVRVTADDGAQHAFDVVYAALGVDPVAGLAAGLGAELDGLGNIVADPHGRTRVEHLYAAGDVVRALDQIGVAVGQAAIAATAVHNSL